MFDGPAPARRAPEDQTAAHDLADLDAILSRYDALVQTPDAITSEESAELAALAGIFDVDANRPIQLVWPELRGVLMVQSPRVPVLSRLAPPLTLMVVEDDADMARDLTALLVEAGHDVVGPFHSAEAAEVAAGLHAIDIALLDINLSGPVDGGTLGRELKTRWGLKVVFLSGDVTAAASHADIAAAMAIKPYRSADILGLLERVSAGVDP